MAISTGAAILGGAAISGGLGLLGSKKAGKSMSDAAGMSADVQREMYGQTRKDLMPFMDAGYSAIYRLQDLMGLSNPESRAARSGRMAPTREQFTKTDAPSIGSNPFRGGMSSRGGYQPGYMAPGGSPSTTFDQAGFDKATADYEARLAGAGAAPEGFGSLAEDFSLENFREDPGYRFRLEEGEKALTRGALARGMNRSTPTLEALMNYNQGMASQEFQASFGRDAVEKDRAYNYLMSMAGMGENAAAKTGSAGMNAASNIGSAAMAGGAGQANAWMTGMGSVNNAIQGGLSNWMYMDRSNNMMNMWKGMFGPSGPSASGSPFSY